MAKFVIAGRADCPRYARAEMLADTLAARLPFFRVHKVVHPTSDWPSWLSDECRRNGWNHSNGQSPLVWRELIDRGGKGLYLGGLQEFEEYASHYYNITAQTEPQVEAQIAKENVANFAELQLERENAVLISPLRVCITNGCSQLAYHLAQQVADGKVFGAKQLVAIHLYHHQPTPAHTQILEGVAMELMDLASPLLNYVRVCGSMKEAFDRAKTAFILDYVYTGSVDTSEELPKPEVDTQSAGNREASSELATNTIVEEPEISTSSSDSGAIAEAAHIYQQYASVMDFTASKDVKVIVSGCFSNTGAAVMSRCVSSLPKTNFIAAPCLAVQQAKSIIAAKLGLNGADISQIGVWGKTHGTVQLDLDHVRVRHFQGSVVGPDPYSLPLTRCIFEPDWLATEFHKLIGSRHTRMEGYRQDGAALVEAIALSRLASSWEECGESCEEWQSVGIVCDGGSYDVPQGLVFTLPAKCIDGQWTPAKDINTSTTVKAGIASQVAELKSEMDVALNAIQSSLPNEQI